MIQVRDEILSLLTEVENCRRHLHQYPEIELNTLKTKAYIMEKLQEYGNFTMDESFLENSIVAHLVVDEKASCIAFRADMDALPIQEENTIAFKSKNDGISHACGHDGHMAILLGFAKYLSQHKNHLKENILLIFQPGEEGPGGAEKMIAAGLFVKYPVRFIFGTHLMADVDAGKVACKAGPLMARNGEITIEVFGQSAHAAMPHLGNDAIVAACSLINQLQTIVSRNVNPLKSTVLSIGKLHGGSASNVICDHVVMNGTMRSFYDESYLLQKQRIQEMCSALETMYNVKVDLKIIDFYGVVDNDTYLNSVLEEVAAKDYISQEAKMIAEDFSFYQKEVPGLFYFTGVKDKNHTKGIHDCHFDFAESSLLYSIEINLRLLTKLGAYYD